MRRRIAIVGGGAAGLAVARALSLTPHPPAIDWYGVPRRFTGGPAYDTVQPWHRLNVPVERMGLPVDAPEDFARWLAARGRLDPGDPFRPRGDYGAYLADWRRRIAGPHLTAIADPVTALRPGAGGWVLSSAAGDRPADAVVLATGNPGLRPLSLPGRQVLNALPGRMAEAGLRRLLPALDPARPIIVLGTGLSMLDHVMSIAAHGWTGRIIGLSRSGLLSETHSLGPAATLDPASLAEGRLSRRLMALRRLIRAHGGVWRAVFDALRPHTPALWQTLTPVDRARFFHRLWSHWNRFRHRAAPSVMQRIEGLRAAGRLELVAADAGRAAGMDASLVVNALGPAYGALAGHPLLAPLGLSMPHGLPGLPLDDDGLVAGDWPAPLHAIGCLGLGARLESVAMPEIRGQAARIAAALAG